MRKTCIEAGIGIVTGDTKVVEKDLLGGCVINISGVGRGIIESSNVTKKAFSSRCMLDSNLSASIRRE